MHETTIVTHLLRLVEQVARDHQAARVTAVRVRVGELAGVDSRLLEWAFEQMAAGTCAEGARLEQEIALLEACCEPCEHRFRVEQFRFACPLCGGGTRVVSGEELVLENVSIEPGPVVVGAVAS